MTLDMSNTDKVNDFRREAMRLGIEVGLPSVNTSGAVFDVENGRILPYSLAAIKGVGAQAVEHLVEARGGRPFRDLAEFAGRINPRILGKRTLESLVVAGAFDEAERDRAASSPSIERIMGIGSAAWSKTSPPARTASISAAPASTRWCCRRPSPGCRPIGCNASMPWSASISPPIRSTNMRPCWKKRRVQN